MKKLLEFIIKSIVDNPKDVKITETKDPSGILLLDLKVNQDDMGKVIGREGNIIKAIRNVLRIKAVKENIRFSLELTETS